MQIINYLKSAYESNGYIDWLIANGKTYIRQQETKSYKGYEKVRKESPRTLCFSNAINNSVICNMKYVEGFYMFKNVPVAFEHAFNVNSNGVLFDFTNKGEKPIEWFGIEIPIEYMAGAIEAGQLLGVTPLQAFYATTELNDIVKQFVEQFNK